MTFKNNISPWQKKKSKINNRCEVWIYPPHEEALLRLFSSLCLLDRSFEDDDSVDGNRSSSAQAAFKVPKVPKKPADSSAARRPSATGGKLGTADLPSMTTVEVKFCLCVLSHDQLKFKHKQVF